jgi:hypothetical protein
MFLFGDSAPESIPCFDMGKLNAARIALIPNFFILDDIYGGKTNKFLPMVKEHLLPQIKQFAGQNETFLCTLLSRLGERTEQNRPNWDWIARFLSQWIIQHCDKKIIETNMIQNDDIATVNKLFFGGAKFTLPSTVVDTLRHILKPDDTKNWYHDKHDLFVCKVFTAVNDNERDNNSLYKQIGRDCVRTKYQMQCIRYFKTHSVFDINNFLLTIPLDLIGYAFEKGASENLSELTLLEKLPVIMIRQFNVDFQDNFQENFVNRYLNIPSSEVLRVEFIYRRALIYPIVGQISQSKNHENKSLCGWGKIFLSAEPEYVEKQVVLFDFFYERVVNSDDPKNAELYTFLEFHTYCILMERMFEKYPERLKLITDRCNRALGSLRTMPWEQLSNIDEEQTHCKCPFLALRFIRERYPFWKCVKPLLLAFRKSKKCWLKNDFSYDRLNSNLVSEISRFFDAEDQDKLKQLRQDMAKGLADLLKQIDAKKRKPDRVHHYSAEEIKREGFDLTFNEPDATWRYAYVRAIADLGVNPTGDGKYIHSILYKFAEIDPSKDVREKEKETADALKNLRSGWDDKNNHKQHLYQAFWWIRQAHMISLGLGSQIDTKEALKLRHREYWE